MEVLRNSDTSNHRLVLEKLAQLLKNYPQATLKDLCQHGLCPLSAAWAARCLHSNR